MSTRKLTLEERAERRVHAMLRRDGAAYLKRGQREEAAQSQIGELCREGRQVFYVWPVGGRYREGPPLKLIDFLIRHNYA